MAIEVRSEQKNLVFDVFVPESERAKSSDLHGAFKAFIAQSEGVENSWVISDWIVTRMHYRPYQDIAYGDGGFDISNIAPKDVPRYLEVLASLCEKLEMKFKEG